MLTWDDSYSIGHEKIDAEHRIFFSLLFDFQNAMDSGATKDKLVRILLEVSKYADFHFVSEENIMMDSHYPDLDHHVSMHQLLLDKINNHYARFRLGEIDAKEVFEFLFKWFAFHTSSEDKKFVGFFEARKVD